MPPISENAQSGGPPTANAATIAAVPSGKVNAIRRRRPLVSATRPPRMSPMLAGVPTAIEKIPIMPPEKSRMSAR
jgi:hypothetical protein